VRRSHRVGLLLALALAALAASFAAARLRALHVPAARLVRGLVEQLQLTDLSLFTEARYTRHPSQADLHSAFMDHPLALEHFPSGSLVPPPGSLVETYENLDRKAEVPD
jgi:hypothetical protein